MTVLIIRWLSSGETRVSQTVKKARHTYQVINSLLRVVRNGIECKSIVDDAIDACGASINLRDTIHDIYQRCQSLKNEEERMALLSRGVVALQRYFYMIIFQSYLECNPPCISKDLISFSDWVKKHPEFETIYESLKIVDDNSLAPVLQFFI
jgi:hypothetical protein